MKIASALGALAVLASLSPAFAQGLTSTGSPLPDQPYTLTYPEVMVSGGEVGGPLTITHPELPLQCVLTVVPVEDTSWTAENALAELNPASVAVAWSETFPGFILGASGITNYKSNAALQYEGSTVASQDAASITLVHTETVAGENGYTLDCFYATDSAADVRPIADSIIANFSTEQAPTP